ncbi:MAG: Phage SPO1 DNA polymerase-related protein [Parcubacteria group bacterium GW2011_GWA2_36_24]|nr:MAG: Phage SPO1 DNA polymerase-related protein [Parcubacteria group bacterium GW2011_GWA2_36_24]
MEKSEELKKIHERWFINCKCELKKTATQPVPGDGNPNSEIIFIGEAPGKEEDKQDRPFIGAAGKFLTEMLEVIHLKREEIYITNIVKYRPPNNRDPLFPAEKISNVHGKLLIKKFNKINPKYFLPLYHPATALYNGSMRETLTEDFRKIPKILKKIKNQEKETENRVK